MTGKVKWCATRCDGTARTGGCTRGMQFASQLRKPAHLTLLPSLRRCLNMIIERSSCWAAGYSCPSIRTPLRATRIAPRSSQPQEHAAHAFEPPRCLPARSQVDFALRAHTVLFRRAAPAPPMLWLASPLESANDAGWFGCLLAEMRAMARRTFGGYLALRSAGVVCVLVVCAWLRVFVGCLWHVECSFSPALWCQLMKLGGSDAFSPSCARWHAVWVVVRSPC